MPDESNSPPTWDDLRAQLEARRRRIVQEIVSYPPPIPACDQQFNHLIEQRERLSRELARLDEWRGRNGEGDLAAFIASSGVIGGMDAEGVFPDAEGMPGHTGA